MSNEANSTYNTDNSHSEGKKGNFLARTAKVIVIKVIQMYLATKNPKMKLWEKGFIFGALVYFLSPIDLISDFIPFLGLSDDMIALLLAIAKITGYIDNDTKEKAKKIVENQKD